MFHCLVIATMHHSGIPNATQSMTAYHGIDSVILGIPSPKLHCGNAANMPYYNAHSESD